ncbi:hypothetical protein HDU82_005707 [Entophlyctis luteolus]|nr:hypothetical protein HDU82_005707 [Entophlyctis luteolus]
MELEEEMRNGIYVAKLARFFSPKSVKRIYNLQFKHSDNINFFFAAMRDVGVPEIFFFETTDLYEKKNFPKVIYCIHALSHVLASNGLAPSIQNLVGHLSFTNDQIKATQQSLEASGASIPQFRNIENALAAAKIAKQIQALVRRKLKQIKYETRMNHFRDNIGAITKIQSLWREKQIRSAYQNFDVDGYEMDEEVENLRLKVAQKIAENASIEAELAETETKIALLIKNRLSIEEVYHQSITCGPSTTTTSAYFKKLKKSATLGRPQVAFEDSSTLFTMKILDKETRHRSNEPGSKEIEKIILEIFGCAQTCYEEYLLLNVLKQSINLQVSHVSALDDFWKINPSFIKLGVQCSRTEAQKSRNPFDSFFAH